MGLAGNVVCLQVTDGKPVWQRSLVADFKGRYPMWNFRESPLVDGDKLICTPGGEDATMVALNKLTGETLWKAQVPDRSSGGQAQNRGFGGGNRPKAMQTDPVLVTLDQDQNQELSTDEVAASPTVLLKLDKNQDGKLSEDEVCPGGRGGGEGGRRRGPGIMRMIKALSALDANENNAIEAAEIQDASAALKKLDSNGDGKLTDDEAGMKSMSPPNTGAAYSSAIAIDFSGQRQYTLFCYDVKAK